MFELTEDEIQSLAKFIGKQDFNQDDWNDIMAVYLKIEETDLCKHTYSWEADYGEGMETQYNWERTIIECEYNSCEIYMWLTLDPPVKLANVVAPTKKQAMVKAFAEFIDWFNETK